MKFRSLNLYCRRNKLKFIVIFGLGFIVYQLSLFRELTDVFKKHNLVSGTHKDQSAFYEPDEKGLFHCILSREKIRFHRVNDNFCDCMDGSDEPGTSACPNGKFYCTYQNEKSGSRNSVPSGMVNDGICDCCDGSDEWLHRRLPFRLSDTKQRELGLFQSPCSNICHK